MPIIRAMFECAVAAQWVFHQPLGAEAITAESHRQQRALAQQMEGIAGDVWPDHAAALRVLNDQLPDVESNVSAKNFEGICTYFEGGDELYPSYRMRCGHTHAGVRVADQYLHLDGDETLSLVRPGSRQDQQTHSGRGSPVRALSGLRSVE